MEQSPSEPNRFSVSQEIPGILWNPNVHYRSHKCRPHVPILSQLECSPYPTPHFLKNIILPSTPRSPHWSISFRFPRQNPVYASPLSHTRYMPRPSHSSRFYNQNNIDRIINQTLLSLPPSLHFPPILLHIHMFLCYTCQKNPSMTNENHKPAQSWNLQLNPAQVVGSQRAQTNIASYHTWRHKELTMSRSGTHRSNYDPLINSMAITQFIWGTYC